jgi:plasmid stabilization system protein ParE
MAKYRLSPAVERDLESIWTYTVYFRVTDYGIAVIRVLHDRMDAPRHL